MRYWTSFFTWTATLLAIPAQASDDLLLKTLIENNRASVAELKTAVVKFSWIDLRAVPPIIQDGVNFGGGPAQTNGESTVWKLGDWYRQDLNYRMTFQNGGMPDQVQDITVAFTDTQFFTLDRAYENLLLHEFESRAKLYPPVDQNHKSYPRPNIMNLAYKVNEVSLEEVLGRPDATRVTVEKKAERSGEVYEISLFVRHKGGEQLRFTGVVAPAQQFLLPRYTFYGLDGAPTLEFEAELDEVSPGLWFPRKIDLKNNLSKNSFHFTISAIALNEPLQESEFTIDALDIEKPGMVMQRIYADGKSGAVLQWWNDKWTPLQDVPVSEWKSERLGQAQ